jgi:predicted DNA-binding transcriptional regulator AlpA
MTKHLHTQQSGRSEVKDKTIGSPEGAASTPSGGKATKPQPEMIGVRDLVTWLGLDRSTIHRMHDRADLPAAFKLGGSLRWYRRDIESWLEGSLVQRGPAPRRRRSHRRTHRTTPPRGGRRPS